MIFATIHLVLLGRSIILFRLLSRYYNGVPAEVFFQTRYMESAFTGLDFISTCVFLGMTVVNVGASRVALQQTIHVFSRPDKSPARE